MRIGILSRNAHLYSTQRLVEEAKVKGYEVSVIDCLKCYMDITATKPAVLYKRNPLKFDAVIPRIGASITLYGTAVLRQFEVAGVYPLNESIAITRSRDKLRAHQLLARKGVDMPVTSYANCSEDTEAIIDLVYGAPLIVKVTESTHGRGVFLAETKKAAQSLINALRELKGNFLVQEFIKEAGGSDIRAFVIGDKVVAAMERKAKPGEFRSNLHQGGVAQLIKLTPKERATAVQAAKVMGLCVAGVDMVRSERGPLVLEVNASPGLNGIEKATGKNIAGMIIEYVDKHIEKGVSRIKKRNL